MKTESILTIKEQDGGLINIYGDAGDYASIKVIKVSPDGTEATCEAQDYLPALISVAVAAIPFSQAYTDCCGVYSDAYSDESAEGFQEFLDKNSVTPNGTTVGDWRKLAEVVITKRETK